MMRRKFHDVEALVDSLEMQIGARDDLIARLEARVKELEKMDAEAATHVESVICMMSDYFTGEPPYVGWKGLGLALREDYAERDRLRAELDRLTARVAQLEGALEHTWKVLDAAGTLNLSNGVQLGPTVWYAKIEEAREMSRAALSQPAQAERYNSKGFRAASARLIANAQPAPEKGGGNDALG
jgi:uncharacterized coiled-coil protein SlyX